MRRDGEAKRKAVNLAAGKGRAGKGRKPAEVIGRGSLAVLAGLVGVILWQPLCAEATTANEIQQNINQQTEQINNINSQIANLEDEHDLIQEKIDDLNAEIQNTMTSIGMMEDEIAAKEGK